MLTELAPDAKIQRFDDDATAAAAFLSGQAQLLATADVVAKDLMDKNPGTELEPKFIMQFSPCYIGVQQGSPELLRWLDTYVHVDLLERLAVGAVREMDRHAAAGELPEHLTHPAAAGRRAPPRSPFRSRHAWPACPPHAPTIDFERTGKQIGFVDIPHSPHEDAWGATRIPIAVIKNGAGPDASSCRPAITATNTRGRSRSAS